MRHNMSMHWWTPQQLLQQPNQSWHKVLSQDTVVWGWYTWIRTLWLRWSWINLKAHTIVIKLRNNICWNTLVISLSFLWRFSGFFLFWYLPLLVANIKLEKPLKHQTRLGLFGHMQKKNDRNKQHVKSMLELIKVQANTFGKRLVD